MNDPDIAYVSEVLCNLMNFEDSDSDLGISLTQKYFAANN